MVRKWRSRLRISTGECGGALWFQEKGQHGWRIAGVEQWLGAGLTCGGGHGTNSCVRGVELEIGGLGELLGPTARLLCCLAGTPVRRSSVVAAAQGLCAAGLYWCGD
jgi:hypothetical protein